MRRTKRHAGLRALRANADRDQHVATAHRAEFDGPTPRAEHHVAASLQPELPGAKSTGERALGIVEAEQGRTGLLPVGFGDRLTEDFTAHVRNLHGRIFRHRVHAYGESVREVRFESEAADTHLAAPRLQHEPPDIQWKRIGTAGGVFGIYEAVSVIINAVTADFSSQRRR